jgi:hypothetical protein
LRLSEKERRGARTVRRRVLCLGFPFLLLGALVLLTPLPPTAFAQEEAAAEDEETLFCSDFDSQAQAQQHLREDPTDPDALDEKDGQDDGIACKTFAYTDPAKDLKPVEAAKGEPAEAQPQEEAGPNVQQRSEGAPKRQKTLMDAGGDLPVPQHSEDEEAVGATSGWRFGWWRIAGMVLSAGVFGFAVKRLVSNA